MSSLPKNRREETDGYGDFCRYRFSAQVEPFTKARLLNVQAETDASGWTRVTILRGISLVVAKLGSAWQGGRVGFELGGVLFVTNPISECTTGRVCAAWPEPYGLFP